MNALWIWIVAFVGMCLAIVAAGIISGSDRYEEYKWRKQRKIYWRTRGPLR